jgi:hypothetical protein
LPDSIVEDMIHCDPEDTYFKPSMQQDIEKVLFCTVSNDAQKKNNVRT